MVQSGQRSKFKSAIFSESLVFGNKKANFPQKREQCTLKPKNKLTVTKKHKKGPNGANN